MNASFKTIWPHFIGSNNAFTADRQTGGRGFLSLSLTGGQTDSMVFLVEKLIVLVEVFDSPKGAFRVEFARTLAESAARISSLLRSFHSG